MTTLFYMYYVAKEWFERAWSALKTVFVPEVVEVTYAPGRHRMPVEHRDADESYADELRAARTQMDDTGEIWMIDGAIEVHDALLRMEQATLSEFNSRLDQILAGFEYDHTVPAENPMTAEVRADIIPWREQVADQLRGLADQVQQDCREVCA